MAGHVLISEAHAPQSRVQRVLRHAARRRAHRWKQKPTVPRQLPKLLQNRYRARREWDAMWLSHLHSPSRDFPCRAFQVEFNPLRGAQLARSNKCKGQQFQSGARLGRSLIVLNGPQQSPEGSRRDNGRTGRHRWRHKRSPQRRGRIVFGARRSDRIAKNIAYRRSQLAGSFVNASRLYLLEDNQDLTRRNLLDRSRSKCGTRKAHEPFELSQCCRRLFVVTLLGRQFARDGCERVRALFGAGDFCRLPDNGRVLAARQALPRVLAGVTSVFSPTSGYKRRSQGSFGRRRNGTLDASASRHRA